MAELGYWNCVGCESAGRARAELFCERIRLADELADTESEEAFASHRAQYYEESGHEPATTPPYGPAELFAISVITASIIDYCNRFLQNRADRRALKEAVFICGGLRRKCFIGTPGGPPQVVYECGIDEQIEKITARLNGNSSNGIG